MSALGYTIIALAKALGLIINLYTLIIVAAVLVSWVNADPYNPVVRILHQLTEPLFMRIRRVMPRALLATRLDFSPIIVLVILIVIETVVGGLLFDLGRSLIH